MTLRFGVVVEVVGALHELGNADAAEEIFAGDGAHDVGHFVPSVRREEVVVEGVERGVGEIGAHERGLILDVGGGGAGLGGVALRGGDDDGLS